MPILVCPLSKVVDMIAARTPERIVSLLDPDFDFPESGPAYAHRHLRLGFHDINVPGEGQIMPSSQHVKAMLAFLAAWDSANAILIHCRAGISRSTATAFIAACLHNPRTDEQDIAVALRRASPLARPNETLVDLADHVLGRNGRMSKAIADTGRHLTWIDVHENEPFEMPSTYLPARGL